MNQQMRPRRVWSGPRPSYKRPLPRVSFIRIRPPAKYPVLPVKSIDSRLHNKIASQYFDHIHKCSHVIVHIRRSCRSSKGDISKKIPPRLRSGLIFKGLRLQTNAECPIRFLRTRMNVTHFMVYTKRTTHSPGPVLDANLI